MLFRSLFSSLLAVSLVAVSTASDAASRGIYGSYRVVNPSVGGAFTNERGPFNFGTQMLATANTTTGGGISIAASQVAPLSGMQFRLFPAFPTVAQQTFTFYSTQLPATFMAGNGAAASGDVSFCPAAGNAGPGNLSCTFFNNPGAGNLPIRMGVNNAPAAPRYGGTLKVLRNVINSRVWFVPIVPTSMNPVAQVSAQPNSIVPARTWTPGITNFKFISDPNSPGPNYTAILGPQGSIMTLGAFVSTPPATDPRFLDGEAWGHKMTTGTVSGSDIFPATVASPPPPHFFFTRAGTDMRVATVSGGLTGNIVLVGGAIASSPSSGNLFDRVAVLSINVPEPGAALGLCAGFAGLIGLASARRRSR